MHRAGRFYSLLFLILTKVAEKRALKLRAHVDINVFMLEKVLEVKLRQGYGGNR